MRISSRAGLMLAIATLALAGEVMPMPTPMDPLPPEEMARMLELAKQRHGEDRAAVAQDMVQQMAAYIERTAGKKPPVSRIDQTWTDPKDTPMEDRGHPQQAAPAMTALKVAKPAWATASGIDRYGHWAKLEVKGQVQVLRYIAPSAFTMGCEERQSTHRVTLTQPYWIGDSPVTQGLWNTVMRNNPSRFTGHADLPVEATAWAEAKAFYDALNATVKGLRATFPTDAQWEHACRAGTTGTHAGKLDDMGWYAANSGNQTHVVKMKLPNAWGVYDMHGNVRQWCADVFVFLRGDPATDPCVGVPDVEGQADPARAIRVTRGGCFDDDAAHVASAVRGSRGPGGASVFKKLNATGVRICIPVDVPAAKSGGGGF